MPGVSPDRSLQHPKAPVGCAHCAANTVSEGHDAIDIGVVVEDGMLLDLPHDEGGYGGRAIDGGDDADGERDGEAADRAGAHGEQDHRRDEGGDVGIDDGRERLFVTAFNGLRWRFV